MNVTAVCTTSDLRKKGPYWPKRVNGTSISGGPKNDQRIFLGLPEHASNCASFGLFLPFVDDITYLLNAVEQGDPGAASQLLPLVYEELRSLAAQRLAHDKPGQTLEATGLVHEAYLRLVGSDAQQHWNSRGHFFAAAAQAMRRILVENARRKKSLKHGGDRDRQDLQGDDVAAPEPSEDLLALDEALNKLAEGNKQAAELVQLRYFAGLTLPEAAQMLGISPRSAGRLWAYARAWLRREIEGARDVGEKS
jgi:RNA polymerase sigma factor (TIGR02999 family)